MSQEDLRPTSQKFAMWLVKSQLGLKISARGRKKAADTALYGVKNETLSVPRSDGSGSTRVRVYKPLDAKGPLPILVYYHGGGYATGWPERHHATYQRLMKAYPCIIVAPAFRLSIEAPYPAGHNDCYDTLLWAAQNAEMLGGRPDWIGVGGNSSGGGLAISMALRARDTGDVKLAFQMPLYPMIDDRASNWTTLPANKITWSRQHGVLAWHLLLKDLRAEKRYEIPEYAVPARATDLSGLPPALSYVGTHDILLNEVETFVQRLKDAGNPARFRTFDTLFHAMEDSVPDAKVSVDVHDWIAREFAELLGQTCAG